MSIETLVVAHRGNSRLAPENTFASFDAALQFAFALETDVQKTKDGRLVLFHDETLERTTNGTGRIQDKTCDEIKHLDAGSWFNKQFSKHAKPEFANEKIVTLEAFLKRYGNKIPINLEIKQPGIQNEVSNMVSQYGLLDTILFTSFDFPTISALKKAVPHAQAGLLVEAKDLSHELVAQVHAEKFTHLLPEASPTIDKETIMKWQQSGLHIWIWGVNNLQLMKETLDKNPNGMFVDFPHIMRRSLRKH